ncbi:hypothetical protein BOTBODRAFT_180681 [Botryobasidium botryosum FD-172 SS1]|uniref:MYND-type domain-containing protein n=1 Tax=Botryobasidium botryosum (strain FD-172 SS1) TaxID=930990 RepID=A0A067M6J8_BOTB1|nr:hypothetical protein BOTBODRAFT_180681 [Botryobasidium botryosum FD-172 SS1]
MSKPNECPHQTGPDPSVKDGDIVCSCQIPPAPLADRRHPESDPSRRGQKNYAQCQFCFKSKLDGVTLKKCSSCHLDEYCSRECQKNAWPRHKALCKRNTTAQQIGKGIPFSEGMWPFFRKHRPTIANCALAALDLVADRTRYLRFVLVIELYPRPESRRVETSFYVADAKVIPVEELDVEAQGMIKPTLFENEEACSMGTALVLLRGNFAHGDTVSSMTGIAFNIYSLLGLVQRPGPPWKEVLKRMLNEGIVL